MSNFIERLLARTPEERRVFTFGLSGAITGLIAIVWISVLVAGTGEGTIVEAEPETSVAASFKAFSDEFSSRAKESINTLDELKSEIESMQSGAGWNVQNDLEKNFGNGAQNGARGSVSIETIDPEKTTQTPESPFNPTAP